MADSTKYASKLKGQRVLVLGGSSGMGFAAAEASIESGATVIISSSSQQKVDNAIERIIKAYPSAKERISGYACNLGDAETLEQNVIDLLDKVDKFDHIIHTAGDALKVTPLSEITVQNAFQASMVRFYAPLMLAKHASKYMPSSPRSSITMTTGTIVDRPIPNWVLPSTTMCAVEGLMRSLAIDLAPIRVNVVAPGAVETELFSSMSSEQFVQAKEEFAKAPTGKIGQPEDVAEAYLYLMRDTNVTGLSVKSNSGLLLK